MECPHCGETNRSKFRVISVRKSQEIARTRARKCSTCDEFSYSVEIPVEAQHVIRGKGAGTWGMHYQVREDVLINLIQSLHQHDQG